MDKIKDLFDNINALIADFNMEREHGALLLLGEDFHNVCGNYQGKSRTLLRCFPQELMPMRILKS